LNNVTTIVKTKIGAIQVPINYDSIPASISIRPESGCAKFPIVERKSAEKPIEKPGICRAADKKGLS
jgi:hypothetical protein